MAFFSDLLKKWFYTNSSSAASSDARIPLLTATGEPKGSDTMANIANALGVLQYKGKISGDVDLDSTNLRQPGVWSLQSLSGTAATTLGFEYGIFVSIGGETGIQIAVELAWAAASSNKVFLRIKWGGEVSSPWRKVMFTY